MMRVLHSKLLSAVGRWKIYIQDVIRKEKLELYKRYSGAAKLVAFLQHVEMKKVVAAFNAWTEEVRRLKAHELLQYQHQCAIRLQAAIRGRIARKRYQEEKARLKAEREYHAATLIQARYRGRFVRRNVKLMLRRIQEEAAAVKIQVKS
jgi:hypothetical protein